MLGVARSTFEQFLQREEKAREAWDNGVLKGRASVRRAQFKLLEAGNATMAIWLGKQLLGQRDAQQVDVSVRHVAEMTDDELIAIAAGSRAGVAAQANGAAKPH